MGNLSRLVRRHPFWIRALSTLFPPFFRVFFFFFSDNVDLFKKEHLQIANNQLTAVPEDLARCKALQKLDVHGNLLLTLPVSIFELPHIKVAAVSSASFGLCALLGYRICKGKVCFVEISAL